MPRTGLPQSLRCIHVSRKQVYAHRDRIKNYYEEGSNAQCHPCTRESESEVKGIPGGMAYIAIRLEPIPKNLQEEISRRRYEGKERYAEKALWKVHWQLTNVLAYQQKRGLAHRDIKPESIMRDEEGNWCLCEPGFANERKCHNFGFLTRLGTSDYRSPALREFPIDRQTPGTVVIQHDPYKSNVFSLGVVLAHLSLLELPAVFMESHILQQSIEAILDGLRSYYSEEWVDLLRLMLSVEEGSRPDFLQLRTHLDAMLLHDDDECLDSYEGASDIQMPVTFVIKSGRNNVRVSPLHTDTVPCIVKVKAAELNQNNRDWVCVVDLSGSLMDEETLKFTKRTINNFVMTLSDRDRFTLVVFSDTAERIFGLVCCTLKAKGRIKTEINNLSVRDLSNLSAGFGMALRIIKGREYSHRASTILLFTDGEPNVGDDPNYFCAPEMDMSGLEQLRVFCFGFGNSVNQKSLLGALACQFSGQYSSLNSGQSCTLAPEDLTTVIARDLEINLQVVDQRVPCDITKIYSADGTNRLAQSLKITEEKYLLFVLQPSAMTLKHDREMLRPFRARLTYKDIEGAHREQEANLDVAFVKWDSDPEYTPEFKEWNRVRELCILQQAEQLAGEKKPEEALECVRNGIYSSGCEANPEAAERLRSKGVLSPVNEGSLGASVATAPSPLYLFR